MTRRLLMVLSVFILVEFAVFYWRHHDMSTSCGKRGSGGPRPIR